MSVVILVDVEDIEIFDSNERTKIARRKQEHDESKPKEKGKWGVAVKTQGPGNVPRTQSEFI